MSGVRTLVPNPWLLTTAVLLRAVSLSRPWFARGASPAATAAFLLQKEANISSLSRLSSPWHRRPELGSPWHRKL